MSELHLALRIDVLDAMARELHGTETLDQVIEDLAYLEASNRRADRRARAEPISCSMTRPLMPVTVSIPEGPHRMLIEVLRLGETLDGLVTALLINEVRHRRTDLHWQITSSDEPIMTTEIAAYDYLVRQPHTTITSTGGHLVYVVTTEVRADVLAQFDATLDAWEDLSEELAALIHLEDEVHDEGANTADGRPRFGGLPTTTIEVRLDAHDHAALERVLGIEDDAGGLLTGLMLNALNGQTESPASPSDSLLIPA